MSKTGSLADPRKIKESAVDHTTAHNEGRARYSGAWVTQALIGLAD